MNLRFQISRIRNRSYRHYNPVSSRHSWALHEGFNLPIFLGSGGVCLPYMWAAGAAALPHMWAAGAAGATAFPHFWVAAGSAALPHTWSAAAVSLFISCSPSLMSYRSCCASSLVSCKGLMHPLFVNRGCCCFPSFVSCSRWCYFFSYVICWCCCTSSFVTAGAAVIPHLCATGAVALP